jgi:sugar lactone lactonase YvrE
MSKSKLLALAALSAACLYAQPGQVKGPARAAAKPVPPQDVTSTAIPGVIGAGQKWKMAWQGEATADGMVGTDDGGLIFAQEQSNRIIKIDEKDNVTILLARSHGPGALSIGINGAIYAVERSCTDPDAVTRASCTEATDIAVLTPDRKVLADKMAEGGAGLGRINDLSVAKNGWVYFTGTGALAMDPSGKVTRIDQNLRTNGIILSTDERQLYVTNGSALAVFDIGPDGKATNQREFGKLEGQGANGDGMTIDAEGRLYVTVTAGSMQGVQVFDKTGKYLGLIPTPRPPITVAFSGPDKKMLYIGGMGATSLGGEQIQFGQGVRATSMTVYKIPVQTQGFTGRAK